MRILIEEYQYSVTDEKRRNYLKVILQELGGFENLEKKVSVNSVGHNKYRSCPCLSTFKQNPLFIKFMRNFVTKFL